MSLFTAGVECPVFDSFRVQQVAGLFDLPLEEKCRQTFQVELPGIEEDWQIGVIVGPSGSGKSTVARQAFGEALYEPCEWPAERAVIDGFGEVPTKTITRLLTAVGFSSPPSWVKPYAVLSNGEKFRCDLARALLKGSVGRVQGSGGKDEDGRMKDEPALVVFDEFTSVVDRKVAQIGSAAVAKAIRGGVLSSNSKDEMAKTSLAGASPGLRRQPPLRELPATSPPDTNAHVGLTPRRSPLKFIAVTCHYDVLPWLEPDWVLDMATGRLKWGRLRRPEIRLELYRARRTAWSLFAKHHYLNPGLSSFASCYLAYWNDSPVGFVAVLSMAGHKGRRRISRVVVLPDFQGVGIGGRITSAVARLLAEQGHTVSITSSHPAMIGWLRQSPDWRVSAVYRCGGHAHKTLQAAPGQARSRRHVASAGRALVSATFVLPPKILNPTPISA